MKRSVQLLGSAGALALALTPTVVAAAGTVAGTTITNTVSVNYTVGGVTQTAVSASDSFTVDQKVDLTVTSINTAGNPATGAPGSTVATTFTVTNGSNKAMDINLVASSAGGDFTPAGTYKIYRETGSNTTFAAGTNTLVTAPLSSIAADATVRIYVVADMVVNATGPVLPTDAQVSNVYLTAQAYKAGAALAQSNLSGANVKNATTPGTDDEVVFADAAGPNDAVKDGKHSAMGVYKVNAAKLTVNKYSYIVSDPTGNSNPRAIPGAVVEYCIVVANGAGASSADSVNVSDVVPSTLTYELNSIVLNATFNTTTNDRCDTGGSPGSDAANWNAGTKTVSNNFGTMAASVTRTLRFQAKIN